MLDFGFVYVVFCLIIILFVRRFEVLKSIVVMLRTPMHHHAYVRGN